MFVACDDFSACDSLSVLDGLLEFSTVDAFFVGLVAVFGGFSSVFIMLTCCWLMSSVRLFWSSLNVIILKIVRLNPIV